jgi:hypothetical protein
MGSVSAVALCTQDTRALVRGTEKHRAEAGNGSILPAPVRPL